MNEYVVVRQRVDSRSDAIVDILGPMEDAGAWVRANIDLIEWDEGENLDKEYEVMVVTPASAESADDFLAEIRKRQEEFDAETPDQRDLRERRGA